MRRKHQGAEELLVSGIKRYTEEYLPIVPWFLDLRDCTESRRKDARFHL
jgi:hypothetical protein